ncbi:MAG TPA: FAD-dependent oxidoreductase [Longimicrobium sp.]|nr:FAD-dependent oxidoreductase [Longimicrobium sp.]
MITAELLTQIPLFAGTPESERAEIAGRAADLHLGAGEWLLQEGELPAFFVLLEGSMAVFKRMGEQDQRLTTYQPGEYFGEVPLLLGAPAIASLRAEEPSRVLRLEPEDFRELVAACPVLAEELVRTMTQRIQRLQRLTIETPPTPATVVGSRWDLACHDVRDFLSRNHILFRWVDPSDANGDDRVQLRSGEAYPLVIGPGGSRISAPSFRALAEHVGLQTAPRNGLDDPYDLVIVGGGPAGLAAAVYGASEGLCTVLVERLAPGGQAGTSSRIENYLGFPAGLSGGELSSRAMQQARRFGAEMMVARGVTGLGMDGNCRWVGLDGGEKVWAKAVVLACGVVWRKLTAPGVDGLVGRGVYYGAARTEAIGTRGKRVFLVGGGNSAGQAAMLFSGYASEVTLLVRGRSLELSMSQYLVEQLATRGNVRVETECEVAEVEGDGHLQAIVVADRRTGARERREADALFAFIGADAETGWLPRALVRDELGYICTGRDVMDLLASREAEWPLQRDPYLLETSIPGVFAAGDVRHGSIKRVASGVGEGSMAIAFVHQYLAQLG